MTDRDDKGQRLDESNARMNTRQRLILRRQNHTALFLAIVGLGTPVYYWAAASIIEGELALPDPESAAWLFLIGALFALTWWLSARLLPKRWAWWMSGYWAIFPVLTFVASIVGLPTGVYLALVFPLPTFLGGALAGAFHYAYLRTRPPAPEPDTSVRPECGYSLVGLERGVCPKCGGPI